MIRWVLWPLSVMLSLMLALTYGFGTVEELPVLSLLVILGGLLIFISAPEDLRLELASFYPLAVALAFVASLPKTPDFKDQVLLIACPLLALGILAQAKFFWGSPLALAGLLVMPALLAFYSSPQGAPGDLAHRIALWLGVSDAIGEALLIGARKSVHFVFYGVMGLLAWLSLKRRPFAFAIGFVLLHAAFDELRQSAYASRTGSVWDVLIDLAGALTFIAIVRARFKRGEQPHPPAQDAP